jgi:hypothetical protein
MVGCLPVSSLNRLEPLKAEIPIAPNLAPANPVRPHRHAVVLPALIRLSFRGMSDYPEDLLARIDTPVLDQLHMVIFTDLVFDVPHFKQFVWSRKRNSSRSRRPSCCSNYGSSDTRGWTGPHGSMFEVRRNRNRLAGRFDSDGPAIRPALTLLLISSNDLTSSGFGMYSELQGKRRHGTHPVPRKISSHLPLSGVSRYLKHLCHSDRPASSGSIHIQEAMQPFVAARQLSGQLTAVHHGSAGSGLGDSLVPSAFSCQAPIDFSSLSFTHVVNRLGHPLRLLLISPSP